MTREEAINFLQIIREDYPLCESEEKSIEMAIKALSQEPCEKCEVGNPCLYCKHEFSQKIEPCDDAVSRQAVKKEINCWIGSGEYRYAMSERFLIDRINDLPSVTPQKSGKWIAQDIHNCHTDFRCSECGYTHSFMHLYGEPTADYTYCPNCGAKMVNPQGDEEA